eukprot:317408-Rhodomonas_salina.1
MGLPTLLCTTPSLCPDEAASNRAVIAALAAKRCVARRALYGAGNWPGALELYRQKFRVVVINQYHVRQRTSQEAPPLFLCTIRNRRPYRTLEKWYSWRQSWYGKEQYSLAQVTKTHCSRSARLGSHPEIKYKKPHCRYKLYRGCGFL